MRKTVAKRLCSLAAAEHIARGRQDSRLITRVVKMITRKTGKSDGQGREILDEEARRTSTYGDASFTRIYRRMKRDYRRGRAA